MPDSVMGEPEVLGEAEARRRALLLEELQAAFAGLGVRCVLARKRRLVLRYDVARCGSSGPVDPELHIFAGDHADIATTDGMAFVLSGGGRHPADDPLAAAAAVVAGARHAGRGGGAIAGCS